MWMEWRRGLGSMLFDEQRKTQVREVDVVSESIFDNGFLLVVQFLFRHEWQLRGNSDGHASLR